MAQDNNTTEARQTKDQLSRRSFIQILGAGLLVTVLPLDAFGQQRNAARNPTPIATRVHIGQDGVITVMTGKVEGGQGARTELTQAAAEELRVSPQSIRLIMADTDLVPDDGITAGSMTTPRTVPPVRQGAAAAREVLIGLAGQRWGVDRKVVTASAGKVTRTDGAQQLTYAELATGPDLTAAIANQNIPTDITVTPVTEWKVLGSPVPRPNVRDLVTGAHLYPSDIVRPGMLYGKVLRPPAYGAKLTGIDLSPAKSMAGVVVLQDGDFVGVAGPTNFAAEQALAAIAKTATWQPASHPSSSTLFAYLKDHARGGIPANPFAAELASATRKVHQQYQVAYVQHAPLEPRAAVAEWEQGKLTVWTGSQNPFGCRQELSRALGVTVDKVRVIVPDFGGGFGGKHQPDATIEAARLAKAAGRPVRIRWTRADEFTWAYFRPAALIDIEAGLDAQNTLTSWHHINVNSGPNAIETPYRIAKAKGQFVPSEPPLRQGSYRALAATANNFARECFMDELAADAGVDPLAFRLAHIENSRLKAVLEAAAQHFNWADHVGRKSPSLGVGLACGTEKGSYVATCVEVAIQEDRIVPRLVCQAFECGAILNPDNLYSQVTGCIIMGLGPALREQMQFQDGRITNASFFDYLVPRFSDVPQLDIQLLNRPDLPSAGAGETPIIAIAPAIANAVFHATGQRIRQMPIRLPKAVA